MGGDGGGQGCVCVCVCVRDTGSGLPQGGSQSAGPRPPREDRGQRSWARGLRREDGESETLGLGTPQGGRRVRDAAGRTGGQRHHGEDGGAVTPQDREPGLP